MSLAYGVDGEISLELENNYGDYADWTYEELMNRIEETLNNMLSFMDDPSERRKVRAMLKSEKAREKIAKEFIEEHQEYMTNIKR